MIEDLTRVTTGEVRLSYVHLFKPYALQPGQEEKFSCTVLVPKTDAATMGRINAAIEAAKAKGVSDKWNGVKPPVLSTPVYDGDGVRPSDGMPFGPECKGHWVFTASAKTDYPPEVVGADGSPIINQSEIYSGIYAYVNVNFFPYTFGSKKGVGCGLGPVMKRRDGEPLSSGSVSAAQVFGGAPQPQQYAAQPQQQYVQPQQQYVQQQYVQPQQQYVQQYTAQVNPITGLPN